MLTTFVSALGASLPDDWLYKESITLLEGEGQANIIFSSEPLSDDIDTNTYADIQGSLLRDEFPEYDQFAREGTRLSGHDAVYRRFQWTPPDGVPVTQIQVYLAHGGRGYTATATTPSASFPDFDMVFGEILERLSIADFGPTVATAAHSRQPQSAD